MCDTDGNLSRSLGLFSKEELNIDSNRKGGASQEQMGIRERSERRLRCLCLYVYVYIKENKRENDVVSKTRKTAPLRLEDAHLCNTSRM